MRLLDVKKITIAMVGINWRTTRGAAGKVQGGLKYEGVGHTNCYHSSTSRGITPWVAKVAEEHMWAKLQLVISQGHQHKGNARPVMLLDIMRGKGMKEGESNGECKHEKQTSDKRVWVTMAYSMHLLHCLGFQDTDLEVTPYNWQFNCIMGDSL